MVTIVDVARKAGVSRATAARVLSGQRKYIREDTRVKVLEAAKELGYYPNTIARSLRTQRTRCVGVITDGISSAFSPMMLAAIEQHCFNRGYSALVCDSGQDSERERRHTEILIQRRVEGIIFVSSWVHEVTTRVTSADIPVIHAYSSTSDPSQTCVVPDDFGGAIAATEHLIRLGHSHIGFIGGPKDWKATIDRFEGYVSALRSHGLHYCESWLGNADWKDPTSGAQVARRILQSDTRPTAVFAGNDIIAAGTIDAASELGLSVPRDLAVVGYDDRDIARFVRPELTTIQLPIHKIGTTAAKLLIDSIEGRPATPGAVVIGCELIVRESCGSRAHRESPHRGVDEGLDEVGD